jgi:cellulose biosynthesis protein BcsQ
MIFIDVAGNYERALTVAIARAHLTLIPSSTTEADIYEAARIARHIQTIYAAFGKTPLYRVLPTRIAPLVTLAQAHGFNEITRLKLPRLMSIIPQRAAYEEIGLSGLPPHYADPGRPTTAKAIADLDQLRSEIETLLSEVYGGETGSTQIPPAELAS